MAVPPSARAKLTSRPLNCSCEPLCSALARNISKILSGGVSYVLRLIFVAYLFKRWNDLFQSERDFSLVVEIQIYSWPVHGPSKHS
jgi:hypothetical protein